MNIELISNPTGVNYASGTVGQVSVTSDDYNGASATELREAIAALIDTTENDVCLTYYDEDSEVLNFGLASNC